MADPSFESVKVPNRNDTTAKNIDNVQVTDASGALVDRQVVVPGDPVDHSLVGRIVEDTPGFDVPGSVVRSAGERKQLSLAELTLIESRKQTELLFYILHAVDPHSTVRLDDLGEEI
jgi:hypothetical protein